MNASHFSSIGFTLLEVLISLVILSTGLLVLSNAQITGLRFNQEAYLQTQAIWQQNSLIERLRACAVVIGKDSCKNDEKNNWRITNTILFPGSESQIKVEGTDYCVIIRWLWDKKFHSILFYAHE